MRPIRTFQDNAVSGFSHAQLKRLSAKLQAKHVQSRQAGDRRLDYIEGWFAISEANAIFGFAGWDRELVQFERTFERSGGQESACGYLARVRLTVHAGSRKIVREGTGFGQARARLLGDAHDRAMKAAETDATKRALITFGNRFGLGLYDKERAGVAGTDLRGFGLLDAHGTPLASHLSAEGFRSGLRQIIGAAKDSAELQALLICNTV